MIYNVRMVAPHVTEFSPVQAETLADAAGNFLGENLKKSLFVRPCNAGRTDGETSYFARLEVQGEGAVTARYFFSGIGRHGGIVTRDPRERSSLAKVERDLGLAPGSLTECEWEGEEPADVAWERKMGRLPANAS